MTDLQHKNAERKTSPLPGDKIWPLWFRENWPLLLPLALLYVPFWWELFVTQPLALSAGKPFVFQMRGGDFINIWTVAKATLSGDVMQIFDLPGFNHTQEAMVGHVLGYYNWSYPPSLIPFILACGLMPYTLAFGCWMAATFAAYAFVVSKGRTSPWLLTLLLALAPASFMNFGDGQNGFLTAALLVGGLRFVNEKPILSGVLFGALSFKFQLCLMAPVFLLAGRHYRVLAVAGITAAALALFSVALYGIGPWVAYVDIVMPFQKSLLEKSGLDLWALKWPTSFYAVRVLGGSAQEGYAAALAMGLAVMIAVIYAARQIGDNDRQAAIVLTAAMLASPYLNNYDMTALSAAVALVLVNLRWRDLSPVTALLLGTMWVLPIMVPTFNNLRCPLSPLLMAGFLLWLIWDGKKQMVQT